MEMLDVLDLFTRLKNVRDYEKLCILCIFWNFAYHKTSSISRTKSQNINVSCILLQLPSLNPLKPGIKLRMKM